MKKLIALALAVLTGFSPIAGQATAPGGLVTANPSQVLQALLDIYQLEGDYMLLCSRSIPKNTVDDFVTALLRYGYYCVENDEDAYRRIAGKPLPKAENRRIFWIVVGNTGNLSLDFTANGSKAYPVSRHAANGPPLTIF